MKDTDIQKEYEKSTGEKCINSGAPNIDYVIWLEKKTIKLQASKDTIQKELLRKAFEAGRDREYSVEWQMGKGKPDFEEWYEKSNPSMVMTPQETKASVKFTAKLVEDMKGNYFTNLPDDVRDFLHRIDGTMEAIVENLYPNQIYEIEINIKSANPDPHPEAINRR